MAIDPKKLKKWTEDAATKAFSITDDDIRAIQGHEVVSSFAKVIGDEMFIALRGPNGFDIRAFALNPISANALAQAIVSAGISAGWFAPPHAVHPEAGGKH